MGRRRTAVIDGGTRFYSDCPGSGNETRAERKAKRRRGSRPDGGAGVSGKGHRR